MKECFLSSCESSAGQEVEMPLRDSLGLVFNGVLSGVFMTDHILGRH